MAGKSKNSNIMSLSGVTPEMQDRLKKIAEKRGISVSKLVRDLLEKHFGKDDDVYTVILSIPSDLKQSPEELQKWMDVKSSGIVKALTNA